MAGVMPSAVKWNTVRASRAMWSSRKNVELLVTYGLSHLRFG